MLTVENLHKSYQVGKTSYEVLKGVSLGVGRGEFVAVMGPSGSGKTTLLNCISCYIPTDSGSIRLGKLDLARLDEDALAQVRNKKLGFVFQDCSLVPELTVRENILLPLALDGSRPDAAFFEELTCLLGIQEKLDCFPHMLSGGQKHRPGADYPALHPPGRRAYGKLRRQDQPKCGGAFEDDGGRLSPDPGDDHPQSGARPAGRPCSAPPGWAHCTIIPTSAGVPHFIGALVLLSTEKAQNCNTAVPQL